MLSRRGSPRDPHRRLVSAPKNAGDKPGFSKIWQFGFLLVYPVFCPFRDRDGPQIPDLHVAMSSYCLVAVRRTLMGRSPFSNGTAARNSLGSSSARGSTGGEGRGSPRSHQANKRTAVQSASVWENSNKISGDHLSALLNPVDTWATKGKRREGWARGTIPPGKASGAPQGPANSVTRFSGTGAGGEAGQHSLLSAQQWMPSKARQCIVLVPQSTCQLQRRRRSSQSRLHREGPILCGCEASPWLRSQSICWVPKRNKVCLILHWGDHDGDTCQNEFVFTLSDQGFPHGSIRAVRGASRCSEFWSSATCKPSAPCVAYDDQIHPRLGANAFLVLAENGLIRTPPCGLSLHTNSTLGNEAT